MQCSKKIEPKDFVSESIMFDESQDD